MILKKRLPKPEELWYKLEAEYYAAHWEALSRNNEAERLGDREVARHFYSGLMGSPSARSKTTVSEGSGGRSQTAIKLFNKMYDNMEQFVGRATPLQDA